MQPPILKKKKSVKIFHGNKLIDYYSWVHQDNILDVLSDSSLLNKEVKKYLNEENKYTNKALANTKKYKNYCLKKLKEESNFQIKHFLTLTKDIHTGQKQPQKAIIQ